MLGLTFAVAIGIFIYKTVEAQVDSGAILLMFKATWGLLTQPFKLPPMLFRFLGPALTGMRKGLRERRANPFGEHIGMDAAQ